MTKFFMKLNFVGIVCTTAVLLYLLVTCTTANAAGYCCQEQPCIPVYEKVGVRTFCNGQICYMEFSAYEYCHWIWCELPLNSNAPAICRTCMIKAAELESVEVEKFREMDLIYYSPSCSSCLDDLFLNGYVYTSQLCSSKI